MLAYHPVATLLAGSWSILLLATTVVFACTENDTMFLHFGPSNSTVFGGIRVDTWGK